MRPTLLNSCARAATAAEARFRISYPEPAVRSSLVIALDEGAAAFVRGLAARRWHGGHFLVFDHLVASGQQSVPDDAVLRDTGGAGVLLSAELDEADVVVMIGVKSDLIHVKRLGPVHVGHRDGDELDLPVHAATLYRGAPRHFSARAP